MTSVLTPPPPAPRLLANLPSSARMPSLIAHLAAEDQQALLDGRGKVSEDEIKAFCRQRAIPFAIRYATPDGSSRSTGEEDRKGVVLGRLRHYLLTGEVLAGTCFPASVVDFSPLPSAPRPEDRLHYGQYDKRNEAMMTLLRSLTGGAYRDGAIARILLNDTWRNGTAPRFDEFARAWQQACRDHDRPNPEWAYLSDRAAGKDTADWKALRQRKAAEVLAVLDRLGTSPSSGARTTAPPPTTSPTP